MMCEFQTSLEQRGNCVDIIGGVETGRLFVFFDPVSELRGVSTSFWEPKSTLTYFVDGDNSDRYLVSH